MLLQRRRRAETCSQVPVVPAVITAKDHLVPTGGSPSDADRHHVRLAPAFAEAHHFGARYDLCKELCRFDFERMVQGQASTQRSLALNRFDDTREGMAQEHGARTHVEVDVFVPVDIPQVSAALAVAVYGRDSEGLELGPAAEQVRLPGDEFSSPAVEFLRGRDITRRTLPHDRAAASTGAVLIQDYLRSESGLLFIWSTGTGILSIGSTKRPRPGGGSASHSLQIRRNKIRVGASNCSIDPNHTTDYTRLDAVRVRRQGGAGPARRELRQRLDPHRRLVGAGVRLHRPRAAKSNAAGPVRSCRRPDGPCGN